MPRIVLPNRVVSDPHRRLERYFEEMDRGRKYEQRVHSDENRTQPNRLTLGNWNAAFLIYAKGMPWKSVSQYIGDDATTTLPLAAIPIEADLLDDWSRHREAVGAVLEPLLACRGVRAANATKLLYQKRPALIPILDSFVCGELDVGLPEKNAPSVLRAIDAFRQVMLLNGNARTLKALKTWVRTAEHLHVQEFVRKRLSTVRILDIMCWGEGARGRDRQYATQLE